MLIPNHSYETKFTDWCPFDTVFIDSVCLLSAVNSAADYSAACTLRAPSTAELRKVASKTARAARRQRHSLEGPSRQADHDHLPRRNSFDVRKHLFSPAACRQPKKMKHRCACLSLLCLPMLILHANLPLVLTVYAKTNASGRCALQ